MARVKFLACKEMVNAEITLAFLPFPPEEHFPRQAEGGRLSPRPPLSGKMDKSVGHSIFMGPTDKDFSRFRRLEKGMECAKRRERKPGRGSGEQSECSCTSRKAER
jgi:hypothetical protein